MRPFRAGKATRDDGLNPDGRAMRRMEREFEAAIAAALVRLGRAVTRDISDDNPREMLDRLRSPEFVQPFQDAVTAELERVAVAGATFGQEQIERRVLGTVKSGPSMWELANNAAALWSTEYGSVLVSALIKTSADRIQAAVAQYITNSEPIGALIERIRGDYGFSPARAQAIAVTEVTRAYAEGNLASWRASGFIERKEWRTNNDELVCPVCGPLAGQVADLNGAFKGGIESPPAHPRCRCWIVPKVD